MKRLLAIVLIPAFLLATHGIAVTSLYCKGELTKQGVGIKACCNDVDKGGCCDTKPELIKVNDNFVKSVVSFDFNKIFDIHLPDFRISVLPEVSVISYVTSYWDKAPPLIRSNLYILYRSLII